MQLRFWTQTMKKQICQKLPKKHVAILNSLRNYIELLSLLQWYEQMFDGTLGDWKTKPVTFELKEGAQDAFQSQVGKL